MLGDDCGLASQPFAVVDARELPVFGPPVVGVVALLVVNPGLSLLPMLSWSAGMYAWWTGTGVGPAPLYGDLDHFGDGCGDAEAENCVLVDSGRLAERGDWEGEW